MFLESDTSPVGLASGPLLYILFAGLRQKLPVCALSGTSVTSGSTTAWKRSCVYCCVVQCAYHMIPIATFLYIARPRSTQTCVPEVEIQLFPIVVLKFVFRFDIG